MLVSGTRVRPTGTRTIAILVVIRTVAGNLNACREDTMSDVKVKEVVAPVVSTVAGLGLIIWGLLKLVGRL